MLQSSPFSFLEKISLISTEFQQITTLILFINLCYLLCCAPKTTALFLKVNRVLINHR